jgi:hypothetical protein
MSAWITFLGKFYKDKKKTHAAYTYKTAMKDAAKVYKKSSGTTRKTRKTLRRRRHGRK